MMTKTIFNNASYNAATFKNKLIISSNRRQFGRVLEGDLASEWTEAIVTAVDKQEAHALCRAILA